ncbi:unnamed protein product [Phytophthora fragariaefolia]|uniref:Unnamed protein product n=1 Tax=Phytophthora fragariaefolia TaxID=1490495 RepID=A0A9W6XKV4_9STRA|nr:unnamed protein product [Phytophthora fragariaefolia]
MGDVDDNSAPPSDPEAAGGSHPRSEVTDFELGDVDLEPSGQGGPSIGETTTIHFQPEADAAASTPPLTSQDGSSSRRQGRHA